MTAVKCSVYIGGLLCITSVFKTALCNQFSIIVGHLVYQHRRLRIHAYADFVDIHLVADNLNACTAPLLL